MISAIGKHAWPSMIWTQLRIVSGSQVRKDLVRHR
jgi:hypothetical protein